MLVSDPREMGVRLATSIPYKIRILEYFVFHAYRKNTDSPWVKLTNNVTQLLLRNVAVCCIRSIFSVRVNDF